LSGIEKEKLIEFILNKITGHSKIAAKINKKKKKKKKKTKKNKKKKKKR